MAILDPISGLITLSNHLGHDFAQYPLDEPIGDIEINGISGIGNTVQGPSIGIYQEYEFSDVLTAIKGRHNMRIGATYRPGSEDIDNGFFVVGRYVFNGTYTGDTVADFLLGKASEFDYGQGRIYYTQAGAIHAFADPVFGPGQVRLANGRTQPNPLATAWRFAMRG